MTNTLVQSEVLADNRIVRSEDAPSVEQLEKQARKSATFIANSVLNAAGEPVQIYSTKTITGRNFSARVDPNFICNAPEAEKTKMREYVKGILAKAKDDTFMRIVRGIGENHPWAENGQWFIQKEYPHLPLALHKNLCPPSGKDPRFTFIVWPDAPIEKGYRNEGYDLIFDPEQRWGVMFGVCYVGQTKMMGVMSLMHELREANIALPSHVSSVKVVLDRNGKKVTINYGVAGLSGTGKSTLSYIGIPIDESKGEKYAVYQDDINYLLLDDQIVDGKKYPSHSAFASELNPYLKTDSVEDLPLLAPAVLSPYSLYENVELAEGGAKLVLNSDKFPNSRAIYGRQDVSVGSKDGVNVGQLHVWVGVTRSTFLPPVMVLPAHVAARTYAVGKSVKTKAVTGGGGGVLRQTGYNPFIYNRADKDTAMFKHLVDNGMQVILLNTGHVNGQKITPKMSREALSWFIRSLDENGKFTQQGELFELPNGSWMRSSDKALVGDFDKFIAELRTAEDEDTAFLKSHEDFKSHPELWDFLK